MKAITINESNRRNFPNTTLGTILEFNQLPQQYYYNSQLYFDFRSRTNLHEPAGFLDVVLAEINTATQYYGSIYLDGGVYRKDAVDKSDEQIQSELIANAESEQQNLIQQTLANQVVEQAQGLDDESSFENQEIFPTWQFPFNYNVGFKCRHFNKSNELKLFKCIQAHTSQENYKPKDVPALFVEIFEPSAGDEYEVWSERTGANASEYSIGKIVWYPERNTQLWISKINFNTAVPDGDVPYNRYWDVYTAKTTQTQTKRT